MREGERMVVRKRVYDAYESSDGYRVLVDRLWPRGLSKEKAHVDSWPKEISPSTELRKWYEHDPEKWPEFQRRFKEELSSPEAKAALDDIVRRAKRGRVTLLYSSHAGDISNAAVLESLLNRRVRAAKS
jgi:uncharacterized protein YeaO (DUF488 family)